MNNKNKWAISIIVVVLITLAFSYFGDSKSSGGDPIKIGFIGALTGDGAVYGEEDANAVRLVVAEINEKGGIDGSLVEVIYEDGQCNASMAVNAARKLINVDNVNIILGATCSGATLAIAPLAEQNEILLFSSYSNSPDVTNAGDYIFRTAPSDAVIGAGAAKFAYENNAKTIAVISENTDFAVGFSNVFKKTFRELGGEITFDELFTPGETDFRSILTKAIATNSDAILVSPQGKTGGFVFKQLRELGYTGQVYGNAVVAGETMFDLSGGATEGVYYSSVAALSEERSKMFLTNYNDMFGKNPDFAYYAGARYDSVNILAEAIDKVGLNSSNIRDYLYNLKSYKGVLGTISFDENGDIEGIEFSNFQIDNSGAGELLD